MCGRACFCAIVYINVNTLVFNDRCCLNKFGVGIKMVVKMNSKLPGIVKSKKLFKMVSITNIQET